MSGAEKAISRKHCTKYVTYEFSLPFIENIPIIITSALFLPAS